MRQLVGPRAFQKLYDPLTRVLEPLRQPKQFSIQQKLYQKLERFVVAVVEAANVFVAVAAVAVESKDVAVAVVVAALEAAVLDAELFVQAAATDNLVSLRSMLCP